jgi:hypothetical protein
MTGMTYVKKITSVASDLGTTVNRVWPPIHRVLTFSLADDMISPRKSLSASIERGNVSIAYGSRLLSRIRIRGIKTDLRLSRRQISAAGGPFVFPFVSVQ